MFLIDYFPDEYFTGSYFPQLGAAVVPPPPLPPPPEPTGRGITLTRYPEQLLTVNGRRVFRVRIEAADAALMPRHLFLMRSNTFDPYTQTRGNEFCAVVSPSDLVDYPIGMPTDNSLPPFFRTDTIDVVVSSRLLAVTLWDTVHEAVCALVEALNRKDKLVEAETTRCGAEEEPASVSMSVSAAN